MGATKQYVLISIRRLPLWVLSLVLGQRTRANLYEKSRPCYIAEAVSLEQAKNEGDAHLGEAAHNDDPY